MWLPSALVTYNTFMLHHLSFSQDAHASFSSVFTWIDEICVIYIIIDSNVCESTNQFNYFKLMRSIEVVTRMECEINFFLCFLLFVVKRNDEHDWNNFFLSVGAQRTRLKYNFTLSMNCIGALHIFFTLCKALIHAWIIISRRDMFARRVY